MGNEQPLMNELIAVRDAKGLSQKDIAETVGCTQSRISKLENAKDVDVRLGDLRAYANAVGCDLVIELRTRLGFDANQNPHTQHTAR